MNKMYKPITTLLFLYVLLALSSFLTTMVPKGFLLGASASSSALLLAFSVIFFQHINHVLIQGETRDNLLKMAFMIFLFMLLRSCRYVDFCELNQGMRYLWYLYYVPCLFIPYYSFCAAISVGKDGSSQKPEWLAYLKWGSVILLLFVLTNDFHQLVFQLNPGFQEHWIDEYSYKFGYYIVYAWIVSLLLLSFLLLIRKCRVSNSKRYAWLPIIPIVTGIISLICIAFGWMPRLHEHYVLEFPDTFCFTVSAAWICIMEIGLMPANASYEAFFKISSLQALIKDKEGKTIYQSGGPVKDSKDVITREHKIRGGTVLWQSDVRALNEMNKQLSALHQELKEEAEIIRLENELKEKRAMIEAKNSLYDAIAIRVLPQSKKITLLSNDKSVENLRKICLYGSYIKRMSNLMLLATQKEEINTMELALAIGESLSQLSKMDVQTSIYMDEEYAYLSAQDVVACYESFEYYLEKVEDNLVGIYVMLKNNVCKMTLEVKHSIPFEKYPNTFVEWDEETCFIRIPIEEKEECV